MGNRASFSLIFLGAQRTDRVDLGPGPAFPVLEQFHQAGRNSDDPAERVETSIASNPKIGKVVWVLWEGASAQVLDLPKGVVHGMEREQLAGALGFEVEPLTGIPAAESAIDGFQLNSTDNAQPEFRRFWITQLTSEVRNKVEDVITKGGARFAGIIHPGGLPRDRWDAKLAPETPHEWQRIEIWDQVTFSLHGLPDGSVDTRIVRSEPGSERWVADLPSEGTIAWMSAGPATKVNSRGQRVPDAQRMAMWDTLMSPGSGGNPVEPVKIDFPEDAAPVDWLRAWVSELTAQKRVPTVEPPSRISPYRKFYVLGGTAAAVALTACLVHGSMLSSKAARAQTQADYLEKSRIAQAPKFNPAIEEAQAAAESEKLQARQKELEKLETSLAAQSDRIETTAAQLAARQIRQNQLHAAHRSALAALFTALADSERNDNPGDIVVKDIRQTENGELRLSGICRRGSVADAFASRLGARLEKAGLNVGAAQKLLRDDRLAYDFTLVLTPMVLFPESPALKPQAAATGDARTNAAIVQAPAGGQKP